MCPGSAAGVGRLATLALPPVSAGNGPGTAPPAAVAASGWWVVVTALRLNPQRCLPSLKRRSGGVRFRRIRAAWRGLASEAAGYRSLPCT